MNWFLEKYKAILRTIGIIEIGIITIMLVSILILIIVQIIMRSVFNEPNAWAEEASVYLFIWITMIGASAALKMMRHITIRTFVSSLNKKLGFFIRITIFSMIMIALVIIIINIPRIIKVEMISNTVCLPIEIPRAFFFSIPLLISMVSMTIVFLYYLLSTIYEFISDKPVTSIIQSNFLDDETEEEKI